MHHTIFGREHVNYGGSSTALYNRLFRKTDDNRWRSLNLDEQELVAGGQQFIHPARI